MADGIGKESGSMSSISSDLDLYRYKYKDNEPQIDGSVVDVAFVSPIFSVYERYRFYLLANSKTIELPSKWRYRPDYVSYEYYGTTAWWQMLMWLNDVKSIEYFIKDKIIVPDSGAVAQIELQAYNNSNGFIDINEDDKHNKTLFTLYTPPNNNLRKIANNFGSTTQSELIESEVRDTQFCREVFNMDIPTLRLKYVDLKNEPIETSIRVVANCRPNLIYGKHYKLVKDSEDKMIRITWDPATIDNAGLLFKLKENDSVEIQYVRYI